MTAPRIDLSGLGKHKNNDEAFISVQQFQLLCLIWKHSTEETVVCTLQRLTRPRSQNLRWQSHSSGTFCPVTPVLSSPRDKHHYVQRSSPKAPGCLCNGPGKMHSSPRAALGGRLIFVPVTHQACHRRCTDSNWRPGGGCCCVCRHCLPLLTAKGSFPCPQLGTSVWPGIDRAIGFTQEGKMTAVLGLGWDPFGGYIW